MTEVHKTTHADANLDKHRDSQDNKPVAGAPITEKADNATQQRLKEREALRAFRLTNDPSNSFAINMEDGSKVADKRPLPEAKPTHHSHDDHGHGHDAQSNHPQSNHQKSGQVGEHTPEPKQNKHEQAEKTEHQRTQPESNIDYKGKTHVPNIKEPVPMPDLAKSHGLATSHADNLLANEHDRYNCHFYTLTCMLGHEPNTWLLPKDCVPLGESQMLKNGFHEVTSGSAGAFDKSTGQLKEGDVILVKDPADSTGMLHSAIVVRSEATGELVIRQKFGPDDPVVDLTGDQFRRAYLNSPNYQFEVWRK